LRKFSKPLDKYHKVWYNYYSKRKAVVIMTRSEKVAMLIKAQQLYTYEEWFEKVGYIYSLMNMKHSPAEEYAIYVEEIIQKHFGSRD
jgi:hypothetical protein